MNILVNEAENINFSRKTKAKINKQANKKQTSKWKKNKTKTQKNPYSLLKSSIFFSLIVTKYS